MYSATLKTEDVSALQKDKSTMTQTLDEMWTTFVWKQAKLVCFPQPGDYQEQFSLSNPQTEETYKYAYTQLHIMYIHSQVLAVHEHNDILPMARTYCRSFAFYSQNRKE